MQPNSVSHHPNFLIERKMADKETGLEQNLVLALLHQPIKVFHFHIGSVYWP